MINHASQVSSLLKLTPPAETLDSLEEMITSGLPFECLDALATLIFPNPKDAYAFKCKIAPELGNLGSVEVLSLPTSQRLERLARTFALAIYVWDDEDNARAYFSNQNLMLNGRTPLETAMTELGSIRVAQLLQQLYFGVSP
jgi:putative toxin-antitoxin system antitoxin component (TIGR02293 family)